MRSSSSGPGLVFFRTAGPQKTTVLPEMALGNQTHRHTHTDQIWSYRGSMAAAAAVLSRFHSAVRMWIMEVIDFLQCPPPGFGGNINIIIFYPMWQIWTEQRSVGINRNILWGNPGHDVFTVVRLIWMDELLSVHSSGWGRNWQQLFCRCRVVVLFHMPKLKNTWFVLHLSFKSVFSPLKFEVFWSSLTMKQRSRCSDPFLWGCKHDRISFHSSSQLTTETRSCF